MHFFVPYFPFRYYWSQIDMKTMVTGCPAERTLKMMSGRWKIFVVDQLLGQTLRFSELQRRVNALTTTGVTAKMLTQELRQMEKDGLVSRHVYAEVPPRVEYSLTPLGESLKPVVEAMIKWGQHYEQEFEGTVTPCEL
jgi:DNA-binding HxlR family transcriptional regulator